MECVKQTACACNGLQDQDVSEMTKLEQWYTKQHEVALSISVSHHLAYVTESS